MEKLLNFAAASTKFLANQELFFSKIDNETVMMDETQGLYFGLNPVASSIWELLTQPLTLQEIITQLVNIYEVSPNQCEQEVPSFLRQLAEHNLIRVIQE